MSWREWVWIWYLLLGLGFKDNGFILVDGMEELCTCKVQSAH